MGPGEGPFFMSKTITHYAAKLASKEAAKELNRQWEGIEVGRRPWKHNKHGKSATATKIRASVYARQFNGRRRRKHYAVARQAKMNLGLPGRPEHDLVNDDLFGFVCLYG